MQIINLLIGIRHGPPAMHSDRHMAEGIMEMPNSGSGFRTADGHLKKSIHLLFLSAMYTRFILTLTMIGLAAAAFSMAQDSAQSRKESNRPDIVVVTKGALSIEGRVIEITLDHIVLDAAPFNSPLKLSTYFIRPVGDYHKIEVEYIQAAIVYEKQKFGRSVAEGALAGAGSLVESADNSGANMKEVGASAIYGLAIGSLVGTAKGLKRKKKLTIPIHGKSENLIFLLNYYQ